MTKEIKCPYCKETIGDSIVKQVMDNLREKAVKINTAKGSKHFSDMAKKRWAKYREDKKS